MSFAIDTNVLIYSVSTSDRRHDTAAHLVSAAFLCSAIVPVQVLAEFTNVCRRKLLLPPGPVAARIDEWRLMFATPPTLASHIDDALDLSGRFKIAFFDALIIAVSRSAGATVLLSEDMQNGAVYDGLRILNPFAPANDAAIAALLTLSL